MKVTEHLKNANGKTLFSFEIIPPKKGKNIQELYDNIDPLIEFNPPFIDVTTSREEYIYIEKKGLFDRKITRMRPGTLGICAAIKHKYEVDTIPDILELIVSLLKPRPSTFKRAMQILDWGPEIKKQGLQILG